MSSRGYIVQAQEVRMPVVVRDASSGAATYLVDAASARRLLPAEELDVVELLPGRALCSIAAIDYRDNDLGDYNEISIAFFVRERRAPRGLPYLGTLADLLQARVATYIRHLPVDQSFTCEAGRTIWGFPKTVQQIDFEYGATSVCARLVADGKHVLTLRLARRGRRRLPEKEMVTYSMIAGALHRTRFSSAAEGAGFRLGGADLELGDHPIADELRALGLPRPALLVSWMERMRGSFQAPEKL